MGRALKPGEEVEWKKLQGSKPSRKSKQPSQTRRDDDPSYQLQDKTSDAQRRGAPKNLKFPSAGDFVA